MMPWFYRVHSRLPVNKPTLSIGAHVPDSGGYIVSFTPFIRSRFKAEKEAKLLRKKHPFGQHSVQQMELTGSSDLQTAKGIVTTTPTPPAPSPPADHGPGEPSQ